jgi:hypothetical protein
MFLLYYCDGLRLCVCGTSAANGPIVYAMNMEHRWNGIYRGKPKDSEKRLSQCHLPTTNPTWTPWARTLTSAMRSRRLNA